MLCLVSRTLELTVMCSEGVAENVAFIVCYHLETLKNVSYVWHCHECVVSWLPISYKFTGIFDS